MLGGDDMANFRLKKKRRLTKTMSGFDCHHLCWLRKSWDYGYSRKLRIHPYCRVFLPKDTLHQYIHRHMQYVPVPSAEATKCALEQLALLTKYGAIHEDDPIEKRLTVLTALFECIEQPTANGFREQLRIVREFKKAPH